MVSAARQFVTFCSLKWITQMPGPYCWNKTIDLPKTFLTPLMLLSLKTKVARKRTCGLMQVPELRSLVMLQRANTTKPILLPMKSDLYKEKVSRIQETQQFSTEPTLNRAYLKKSLCAVLFLTKLWVVCDSTSAVKLRIYWPIYGF